MSAPPPDAALLAALAGDRDALGQVARAWLPQLYAWCARLGGPGIDAEDAAHEVLIVMCRRISHVHAPEALPAWLFATCRRVVANHRRRAWFRRWVPGPVQERPTRSWGPERTAEAQQAGEVVWAALDALPAAQREVLVLCELEERSGAEAAALLDLPLGTVKSRLAAARRAFRASVEATAPAMAAPVAEVS